MLGINVWLKVAMPIWVSADKNDTQSPTCYYRIRSITGQCDSVCSHGSDYKDICQIYSYITVVCPTSYLVGSGIKDSLVM